MKKTIKNRVERTVEKLRPIDDTFFHKLAEDPAFCEEMLQVILQKKDLKVVHVDPQKSLRNIEGRSVIVDVLCKDIHNNFYNIEVQKQDNDDHQRRVRYNASNVDTYVTEKGIKFSEIPDVYIVYISSFDFFKEHHTIYHIDRVIRETGTTVDNGFYEIYVNTEVDDESDIAGLMKIFRSSDVLYDERFPTICTRVRHLKEEEGDGNMCSVIEEFRQEVAMETRILTYMEVGFSIEEIAQRMKLSKEEIEEILQENEDNAF